MAQNEAVIQKQDTQNATTSQSDKVNQNPTARNVGQLNATVQVANTQVNAAITPEDVTNMLKSKRVDTKTATGITDAIVASLNGQELTKTQSERLSSALDSPTVVSVISEPMKKKPAAVDSAQNRMYDNSDVRDGPTDEEKAALWNLANQNAAAYRNHDHITATEDATSYQSPKAPSEGKDESSIDTQKPYTTSRPSYGKGQVEQVWEMNKDSAGKVWDPSGVELIWDPTKPRNGQWDMGHLPEHKYSVWHQKYIDDELSMEEFLEWYRNPAHYRPELPSTNRSHKYE